VWQIFQQTRAMHRKKCQERLKNLWMLTCCRQRAGSRPRKRVLQGRNSGFLLRWDTVCRESPIGLAAEARTLFPQGTKGLLARSKYLHAYFLYWFPTCLHPIWNTCMFKQLSLLL